MHTNLDPRSQRRPGAAKAKRLTFEDRFVDEARFIKTWIESPVKTGAVAPSGRFLARAMAKCVDPTKPGLVIELGPGTGPVTDALIERGIDPRRLVLVEFDPKFCALLRERFPEARIVQGDAYRLSATLGGLIREPINAIVSSLPLLNAKDHDRVALLIDAFRLMGRDGTFVQFTYGLQSPIKFERDARLAHSFRAVAGQPVWLNLPPARVWRYTRRDSNIAPLELHQKKKKLPIDPALSSAKRILRDLVDGRPQRRL